MYTTENMMPCEILRRLGIDYRLLGKKRVQGITQNIKKQHERDGDFSGRRSSEQSKQQLKRSAEQKLERLRAENEYMKQELEFEKK